MKKSPEQRFWDKVNKDGPTMPHMDSACWIWIGGSITEFGYGGFSVAHKKYMSAHRFSWQLHYGAIPNGLFVLHRCDNPSCANPEHLWLGTQADNMADKMAKGRFRNGAYTHPEQYRRGKNHHNSLRPERLARGESHANAKLSKAQVLEIRQRYDSAPKKWGLLPKLAAEYGVHLSNIFLIVKRKNWKHI